ncbi:MAG: hypothetical protein U0792_07920 [Gemmataceae bacterium]
MGSNNAIGTGALILSANADKMLADVDRAVKGTKQKLKETTAGNFGKFLDGAAIGAGFGLVTKVAGEAVSAVAEMFSNAAKFRAEMERSALLSSEIAKAGDRFAKGFDEQLAAITNPAERLAELEAQIKRWENERSGDVAKYSSALAELNKLNDPSKLDDYVNRFKFWAYGGLDRETKTLEAQINEAAVAASKAGDRLAAMRQEAARLKMPENDPKLIAGVNQLADAFERQRKTLGMTAEEAQIYALKMQGATDAMLSKAIEQQKLLEKAQKEFAPVQLAGALSKGSTEAYSLVAKFQAAGTVKEGQEKKREAEAKEQTRILGLILKELTGAEVFKVG